MSIRAARVRAVLGLGAVVLSAGACVPTPGPAPTTTTTTSTTVPSSPQSSAITGLSFANSGHTFEYCVTPGNTSGVISVRLRAATSNPPVSGQIIGVSFDQSAVTPLAVGDTAVSAPFAAGSCHDVHLDRIAASSIDADFEVLH